MSEDNLFLFVWTVVAVLAAWGLIWVSDQTDPWKRDDDDDRD